MYFGTYKKDDDDIRIPKNYNGTYFIDSHGDDDKKFKGEHNQPEEKQDIADPPRCDDRDRTLGILESGGIFERIFGKDIKPGIPKFDSEDLLLLGLAAFLFFSKSGDRECAIILALLIFIT